MTQDSTDECVDCGAELVEDDEHGTLCLGCSPDWLLPDGGTTDSQEQLHAEPKRRTDCGGYTLTVWPPGGKEKDGTPRHVGRWTFQNGLIRYQVEHVIHDDVLNACAGRTKLRHNSGTIHRNDLNDEIDADTHHDVETIDEHFPRRSFDTVVFDPPWSQKQADEHYDGMHARQSGPAREKLARLVRPGGTFVEMGFNMYAPEDINDLQGWTRDEVHIFRRGPGGRPPAYMVVDRYPQMTLGGGA